MTSTHPIRYRVVISELDADGKVVITASSRPPYGYHHIYRDYADGSGWLMATIDCRVDRERLMQIVEVIAEKTPIVIETVVGCSGVYEQEAK